MTGSLKRVLPAAAGPVAIVGGVLLVYRELAFGGLVTNQHSDILGLVLPQYCFLGKALASGHVPAYNPYLLSGVRFAGDPQSGWMYLPAMLLFSVLSCGAAIRWYIVLQPILAGLGVYVLLRSERASRPAAAVGGIALALVMADSSIGLSVAMSSSIAWTALTLAGASRFLRASTWPARIGWAVATAAAWGQLAGAYMSTGLAMGTLGLLTFVAVRTIADVLAGRRTPIRAVGIAVLLLAVLVPVNLAVFLPRASYLPNTTLAHGYDHLAALSHHILGVGRTRVHPGGLPPGWVLGFANAPGSYLGAVTLALAFAAVWTKRHRPLAVAFAAYGGLLYALPLRVVAQWVFRHAHGLPLVDFYLHDPPRLRYGFVLPMAILGGVGLVAWLEPRPVWQRALMLAPGVLVFGILPGLAHVPNDYSLLFVVGGPVSLVLLASVAKVRRVAVLVPLMVLGELLAGGFAGQATAFVGNSLGTFRSADGTFPPYLRPSIDAAAYTRPDAIARELARRQGRYLSDDPSLSGRTGYLRWQRPEFWSLEANGRSMLFRLHDVQGYDSVQPLRYWELIRLLQRVRLAYNVTTPVRPSTHLMDLLGVGWVVGPVRPPPAAGLVPVLRDGPWELYWRPAPASAGTVFTRWRVVPDAAGSVGTVSSPGFDPDTSLVVESTTAKPSATGTGRPSSAGVRWIGSQRESVDVDATGPAMVLIRTQWDPDWHARVDGRPAPVLAADLAFQAVPVPAGRHTVVVSFDDPSVGHGMAGSALVLILLGGTAAALRRRHVRPAIASPSSRPE